MNNVELSQDTGPRDVFFQLLLTIGLYAIIIGFGSLVFQLINIAFPDTLRNEAFRSLRGGLRWPLSVLVIVFPLYIWLARKLQKEALESAVKRAMKTRKWLLYLTLFLAAIAIVVDLITLIFHFLGGELTIRFALKALTVLFMALAVFVYYSWNLKQDELASANPKMKFFVWGVVIVVIAAIITGFVVAGSPQSERLRRFDFQRAGHLQSLQSQIVEYWRVKRVLPIALADLTDDITGFTPPTDPETSAPYEYRVTGDLSFELCATFNIASQEDLTTRGVKPYGNFGINVGIDGRWKHDAGRNCFSRTIDPDRFPKRPQ